MELWARVGLVGALVGELAAVVEREVDGLLANGVVAARSQGSECSCWLRPPCHRSPDGSHKTLSGKWGGNRL